MKTIRWGIMGAGAIARKWLCGALQLPDTQVVAIASRRVESARLLAAEYGDWLQVEESCEALVRRPDIDAIYVAAPHTEHLPLSKLALEAGKAVLCEKPLAPCGKQVRDMIRLAETGNRFLMEGMWMRFFPAFQKAKALIAEGAIGDICAVEASFAFRSPDENREGRLLSPGLAGGAILDVGVYGLHFCQAMLEQWPREAVGMSSTQSAGQQYEVDVQTNISLHFGGGVLGHVFCAVKTEAGDHATVYGTTGKITFPRFWSPTRFVLEGKGEPEPFDFPIVQKNAAHPDTGFQYEIAHVNDCLRQGKKQSPVVPLESSLRILDICDELRKQQGIIYPFEG